MIDLHLDSDGFGPDKLDPGFDLSPDEIARLETLIAELGRWRKSINLVGPREWDRIWQRHVLDSLQLWPLRRSQDRSWLDLGSGAGFPALVIGCLMVETEMKLTCVEAVGKKASFLRQAARATNAPVKVIADRIESVPRGTFDIISARALASLPRLIEHASRFAGEDSICLFPKGREAQEEIVEAQKSWTFDYEARHSISDTEGQILILQNLRRR